jgi:ribosomal protein S12 methylthiotransferase accessory factor
MIKTNLERSLAPEEALTLITDELKQLGLSWKETILGDEPKTYRTQITNRHGAELSVGNGKGLGLQSRTSALFEAYEHYLTSCNKKIEAIKQEIEFLTIEEIASFDRTASEKPIELLLEKYPKEKIPCQRFVSLDRKDHIYYPLWLTTSDYIINPLKGDTFNYGSAAKYTSNSGSAIGIGFEEAAIHAVGEVLERDAHSMLLLESFIASNPKDLQLIKKESIPDYLRELVERIEITLQADLKIIDMTSDFALPSFCVTLDAPLWFKPMVGAGASLSKAYALERAILESLQTAHICLNDEKSASEDDHLIEVIRSYPKYFDCATHNFSKLVSQGHFAEIDYANVVDYPDLNSLPDRLSTLDSLVCRNGYRIYTATSYHSNKGIVCLHVVIPGAERFFFVQLGVLVLPSSRGRSVLPVKPIKTPGVEHTSRLHLK